MVDEACALHTLTYLPLVVLCNAFKIHHASNDEKITDARMLKICIYVFLFISYLYISQIEEGLLLSILFQIIN